MSTFDPYKIEVVGVQSGASEPIVSLLQGIHTGPSVDSLLMKIEYGPTGKRTHFNLRVFQSGAKIPIKSLSVHQDPDDVTEWDADLQI